MEFEKHSLTLCIPEVRKLCVILHRRLLHVQGKLCVDERAVHREVNYAHMAPFRVLCTLKT